MNNLQIAVIQLFCRLVGAVARRFGQPQVVAEMIAGGMDRRRRAIRRIIFSRRRSAGWRVTIFDFKAAGNLRPVAAGRTS